MSPLNIVVGITGGIAAYKAVGVVRALVLAGHDVHVVPTEGALRFVGRPTLEAISRSATERGLSSIDESTSGPTLSNRLPSWRSA
jgi:phosphopantothenoylcysteine decarboxylase/phosphopantothenate--cysteine ligase